MPYYRGDYYRGDYYRGDPGLFSWIAQKAIPFGRRVIGAIAGAGGATKAIVKAGERAVIQHPVMTAAGAAGAIGVAAGAAAERLMLPGAVAGVGMKGFHMTRAQRVPKRPEPHLARNRRMRVTNPRALRRAIRRAHGFARLAVKVLSFTSPRKVRGRHAYFKKRRQK